MGSNFFKSLNMYQTVTFLGPSGKLSLKTPLADNLHFFATGTGIAPFISIFYELININYKKNINLYFGVRTEKDIFFLDKLDYFSKHLKNFKYKLFYSRPQNPTVPAQRITSALSSIDILGSQFYLCGHPEMVKEVSLNLTQKGVSRENIVMEKFTRSKQTHIT